MEILKCLLGIIVVALPFVLMYGLGRLSMGKKYNEDTDFIDVMISGWRLMFLIAAGILLFLFCYLIGDEILK
jgi:peptidoglycan biosynthesis protein MviN/MurJ (putative lipid II flippase)